MNVSKDLLQHEGQVRSLGHQLLPENVMNRYSDLCQYIALTGRAEDWVEERSEFVAMVQKGTSELLAAKAVFPRETTAEGLKHIVRAYLSEQLKDYLHNTLLPRRLDIQGVFRAQKLLTRISSEEGYMSINRVYPEAYGKHFRLLYFRLFSPALTKSLPVDWYWDLVFMVRGRMFYTERSMNELYNELWQRGDDTTFADAIAEIAKLREQSDTCVGVPGLWLTEYHLAQQVDAQEQGR